MSVPTVEELVVKAVPEGLQETSDQMDELEEDLADSANAMDEQASAFNRFSRRLKGVVGALVASLAVSTGFLLSRVPVLGELVRGLVSVFDALAYQVDKRLRPALGPIIDQFYELSAAIYEGDFDQAANIVGDIATAIQDAVSQIDVGNIFNSIGNAITTFLDNQGIGGELESTLVTAVANGISALASIVGQVAKELTQLLVTIVKEVNWETVVEQVRVEFAALGDQFTSVAEDVAGSINWLSVAKTIVTTLAKAIFGLLKAGASASGVVLLFQAGVKIAQRIIDGIVSTLRDIDLGAMIDAGESIIDGIIQGIKNRLPDLNDMLSRIPGIDSVDTSDVGGVDPRMQGPRPNYPGDSPNDSGYTGMSPNSVRVEIDGREVARSTDKYRDNNTSRRGVFGP